jgi:hypothetical protein
MEIEIRGIKIMCALFLNSLRLRQIQENKGKACNNQREVKNACEILHG